MSHILFSVLSRTSHEFQFFCTPLPSKIKMHDKCCVNVVKREKINTTQYRSQEFVDLYIHSPDLLPWTHVYHVIAQQWLSLFVPVFQLSAVMSLYPSIHFTNQLTVFWAILQHVGIRPYAIFTLALDGSERSVLLQSCLTLGKNLHCVWERRLGGPHSYSRCGNEE